MPTYLEFLWRPSPTDALAVPPHCATLLDCCPDFLRDTLILCLVQLATYALSKVLLRALSPAFGQLDSKRQHVAGAYVGALLHHLRVVPLAVSALSADFLHARLDSALIARVAAPWSAAYLLSDLCLSGIPDALEGKFEYLLHHCLGLLITVGVLFKPPVLMRWGPHLLIW